MSDLRLTFAIGDYLHIREITLGRVKPEGIDLTVLTLPLETIAYRFLAAYEWEVSEFSLATYCAMVANGDCPMVGLPVFPSRVFRHGSIFVREDSPIKSGADLKDKKIGVPQWTQTAVTYVRGWMQHEAGVPLTSIDWIQAGVNEAGRKEMTTFELPPGYRLTSVPDKTLGGMLASGELDAVISARPPDVFLDGKHGIKRLIPRLPGAGRGLFPQDRHLSDHASRGAAPRRLRGQPLDRAQPDGGVREIQARVPARTVPGHDVIPAGRMGLRSRRGDQPNDVSGQRSMALRHREQSQDAGAVPHILPRPGRDPAQAQRSRSCFRKRSASR